MIHEFRTMMIRNFSFILIVMLTNLLHMQDALIPFFNPIQTATPSICYFSGAGIYFWWQLGCAKYMKENCNLDKFDTFIGASAGSLTAAVLLSGADMEALAKDAIQLTEESGVYDRKTGLAGICGGLVKTWLENSIPETLTQDKLKKLQIALTTLTSRPKLVSGLENKQELIDACLASCHVPVFFDGRPFTEYKGENVVDGSFWYFITKDRYTGLPYPENYDRNDIFWVDYVDDELFMQSISGNFLELATPDKVYDMIDAGYNFMKRQHFNSNLPYTNSNQPNFVTSTVMETVSKFPKNIAKISSFLNFYKQYARL